MKKLIMALAVVVIAATTQAATFRWYNGAAIAPLGKVTSFASPNTVFS